MTRSHSLPEARHFVPLSLFDASRPMSATEWRAPSGKER